MIEASSRAPAPADPGRRSFLDKLIGGGFLALAGFVVYPMARFLVPPRVAESEEASVVAAKVAGLPKNTGKIFRFGRKPAIVVHTPMGELRAFEATCTHLDCIVQYVPERKAILCACHNGLYDLNGRNLSGPPPRPLQTYGVKVVGDKIVVSRS